MKSKNTPPVCPVGETQCEYLDEVVQLRRKIRELSEMVHTDSLTKIYNYRFLIQALELEIERTRRSNQPTVLIMIDLDHFKKVNDTWGHDVGNQALVQTAESLRQAVRKLDVPCRYGGEEFAIILPSTQLIIGAQVAERIRKIIETTPLLAGDKEIKLTASFGVDVYEDSHSDTAESFIKRADKYLYQAKKLGRNCVCHAVSERLNDENQVSQSEKDTLFKLFDN